jgi:hypothetical protein
MVGNGFVRLGCEGNIYKERRVKLAPGVVFGAVSADVRQRHLYDEGASMSRLTMNLNRPGVLIDNPACNGQA